MFNVHTKLRVLALVRNDSQVADETERLLAFLYKSRVKAESKVLFYYTHQLEIVYNLRHQ
jgi:hypothetical protein